MSEVVERMARVIFTARFHPSDAASEKVVDRARADWPEDWARAKSTARAVIAAMREPTDAMHNGARDWSYGKYGKPIGTDASAGCWASMIDAALNESAPTPASVGEAKRPNPNPPALNEGKA